MKPLPVAALVIAGAVVAGCGTVRENQFNETPLNERVEYDYRHTGTDVVHVGPTYRLIPVEPDYRVVVPMTRYYYID